MTKYWKMEILVDDEVIRRYHELEAEDPETDQTLVSDWLSDLVIDARAAHEHAQENPGPDCAAVAELQFARTRDGRPRDGNFLLVRADPVDGVNAADAATGITTDDARSDQD